MRKFRYEKNVNVVFYDEKDIKSNTALKDVRWQIGKRCVIQKDDKYVIFMYVEKGQKWANEKFYLAHEIGHIKCGDLANEYYADEYAFERCGKAKSIDALTNLIIESAVEKFASEEVRKYVIQNVYRRMQVIDIL